MSAIRLTLEVLREAVAGEAVAIRARSRLEPAGGEGDKVFPPTYMKGGAQKTKYAFEDRKYGGAVVRTVLLDSVASQANRMEEALLSGQEHGELDVPIVAVDFRNLPSFPQLADLDRITSLQAPHRIADALLRDSLLGGVPFRLTEIGKAITDSRPAHATGMYRYCPTALVFGCWDSTGPKGGMGSKFQRCLVSEIVGLDAVGGVKTASRIDPAGIQKKGVTIYHSANDPTDWTESETEALKEKGKPVVFSRKGQGERGSPAALNHGNIPPTIDSEAGGVTISHAIQTIVLSLAGLRRLRFRVHCDGTSIPDNDRVAAEISARTALAALALCAIVYQREEMFDLRSRALLVATEPLALEMLCRDGGNPRPITIDRELARSLLSSAVAEAARHGLDWCHEPVVLTPADKLASLIARSRELAAAGEAEAAQ